MFTTGSKLLLGGTVISALTAVVWGVTSSGASGWVGVVGLVSLSLAFALLLGVNMYARDCNVPVSAPDAATASAAARQPAGRGVWPAIAGLGIGGIALGTFTKPIVFKAGVIVLLAALVEWLVQAWSERASADEAYNASLRKRVLHPLEMPLLGAIGVAVMIYSFSRIMLFLSKQAGPIAFIIVGVLILAFATMFALQPTVKRGVIIGVCAIGAIGLVSAGGAMAISGQRTIDRHPATSDDDSAQCLRDESDVLNNKEYEEIERHTSERVAAKSSPMAEIELKDGKLSAAIVGIDGPQNAITVARSNTVNLLFTNRDAEKSRLTAFAGTEVTTVNNVEIKTDRLTCTTLLKQDAQTLLTVTFPKSSASAAPDAPFRLFVPGLEGQEILVTVP